MSHADGDSELGQVGGMEAVIVGTLVFVFSTLLIVNAWAVVDAKLAVQAAAREATRAFVEAPDTASAMAAADAAGRQAIAGHGRDPERLRLVAPNAAVRRCAVVSVTGEYPVRLTPLRLLGRAGGTLTVSATHTERVDAYRGGLAGSASC